MSRNDRYDEAQAQAQTLIDPHATPADAAVEYTVSVRNLCAFAARAGDLDLRFTPSPTALQGRHGHQMVAQRRGPEHESEVSLSGCYRGLHVRGRADGFDAGRNTLEEIKTFRGALDAMAPNQRALHWAQLRIYGALMCRSRALDRLTLSLVYVDVADQSEHPMVEEATADALQLFFEDLCVRFLGWARQEQNHRLERDRALGQLEFPQKPFRPGQRDLAAAVYRACLQSRPLMVQAPTGIGKTIGTIFPALRAMPDRATDKLFFLTAKTPGRQVALDALCQLRDARGTDGATALPLRVIELVARDKACEHPDKACHGQSCPLARGFYDRLPAARSAAAQLAWLDQRALRDVALGHGICPYYLGHEMLRWSDVVVADYNYYFDRSAMLYALTVETAWRVTVLVDEAHNLVPRACGMYSADLTQAEALAIRPDMPAQLRARLDGWLNQWQLLHADRARQLPGQPWQLLDAVPEAWLRALQKLNAGLGEHVNAQRVDSDSALLPFYFRTLGFAALADAFGGHSLCEFDRTDAFAPTPEQDAAAQASLHGGEFDDLHDMGGKLTLRNIEPGHFLAQRIQAADALVLFSATLHPAHYYSSLLGLPDDTRVMALPSPFSTDQLTVRIVPLSTRRDDRMASLDRLVGAITTQFDSQPGNYLAFFSSFDYLESALLRLRETRSDIPVWSQARQMDEAARRDFLHRFDHAGQGVGFAVLGGVFGEGVDLPGRRLIGAFVATIGLPQFDPVNEAIRARMQQRFGNGYDFTYVFPGMQKVVQAAGRVIRSERDTGCVILLDDRYRQRRFRELLPDWWTITMT